mgnify:CR=1 FL=1
MRGEHYNKARRNLIEYYNICPLCKWSTNDCRITEWNRECIACTNPEWFGYSYKSKTITSMVNIYGWGGITVLDNKGNINKSDSKPVFHNKITGWMMQNWRPVKQWNRFWL